MLDKLQKANELNSQMSELSKKLEVIKNVLKNNYDDGAIGLPKIGIQLKPDGSTNAMWLDAKYLPTETLQFLNKYTQNVSDHMKTIEKELSELFK